ncbi:hypothetical protein H1P_4350009 [Hyella patelloides LEGE 07179]|uniref:Uncharacterized protein n=1 Tax=Hyella patelloides LEGE 07179 TaxID=945734 RepID=A0A563VXZ1_9CYAN|nr:hypothetical protein [Hyella patelloides]VEP16324.1 hypothetical protein H1P_4350009 [Hyella patelloides LEGE 07179]
MATYLISIQVKPLSASNVAEKMNEIMAFQEKEAFYHLAGAEQISDQLKVALPEIHLNNPQIIRFGVGNLRYDFSVTRSLTK